MSLAFLPLNLANTVQKMHANQSPSAAGMKWIFSSIPTTFSVRIKTTPLNPDIPEVKAGNHGSNK
jgi:hypothetical protein